MASADVLAHRASQPALTSVQDPLPSATVWEALHGALDRMVARTTDCVSDVQQAAGVLGQSRDYERDALAKLEQAREARERGESRGLGEEEEIEGAEGRVVAARQRVLAAEQALQDAQARAEDVPDARGVNGDGCLRSGFHAA